MSASTRHRCFAPLLLLGISAPVFAATPSVQTVAPATLTFPSLNLATTSQPTAAPDAPLTPTTLPDAEPEQLEAEFETRSDGLWGVYRFKRGWGGEVIRSAGAWDRVYNPVIYFFYKLGVRKWKTAS